MRPRAHGPGDARKGDAQMGEREKKPVSTCQGVSAWDEPCTRTATRYCKECGRCNGCAASVRNVRRRRELAAKRLPLSRHLSLIDVDVDGYWH